MKTTQHEVRLTHILHSTFGFIPVFTFVNLAPPSRYPVINKHQIISSINVQHNQKRAAALLDANILFKLKSA